MIKRVKLPEKRGFGKNLDDDRIVGVYPTDDSNIVEFSNGARKTFVRLSPEALDAVVEIWAYIKAEPKALNWEYIVRLGSALPRNDA